MGKAAAETFARGPQRISLTLGGRRPIELKGGGRERKTVKSVRREAKIFTSVGGAGPVYHKSRKKKAPPHQMRSSEGKQGGENHDSYRTPRPSPGNSRLRQRIPGPFVSGCGVEKVSRDF